MELNRTIKVYLFDQSWALIFTAMVIAQFVAAAGIEDFVLNPRFHVARLPVGILIDEIPACLIIWPTLLYIFRTISRFKSLFGAVRATILAVIVLLIAEYFNPDSKGHYEAVIDFLFLVVLYAMVSSIVLFLVKGSASYFEPIIQKSVLPVQDGDEPLIKKTKWVVWWLYSTMLLLFLIAVEYGYIHSKNNDSYKAASTESMQQMNDAQPTDPLSATPGYDPKTAIWKIYDETDISVSQMDVNSLLGIGNALRKIYIVTNFKQPLEINMVKSIILLYEFDCNKGQFRIVTTDGFTGDFAQGNHVVSTNSETIVAQGGQAVSYRPIGAHDILRKAYDFACGKEPLETQASSNQNVQVDDKPENVIDSTVSINSQETQNSHTTPSQQKREPEPEPDPAKCRQGLEQYHGNLLSITEENFNVNCNLKPKEYLCFIRSVSAYSKKVGDNHVTMINEHDLAAKCGIDMTEQSSETVPH
jgi:hypothetical protein